MSRRMACSMTVDAVLDRSKPVTRRHVDRWATLKPGDPLTLIEKGMGLAKGEKQVVLAEVEIIDVRVEQLGLLYQWDTGLGWHVGTSYGYAEMAAEGVPDMEPCTFARWWAYSHGHRAEWDAGRGHAIECRRIEWRYLPLVCVGCGTEIPDRMECVHCDSPTCSTCCPCEKHIYGDSELAAAFGRVLDEIADECDFRVIP